MVASLPLSPSPAAVEPMLLDFGGQLTPYLGGVTQRINRLGNRWALKVTMPPMTASVAGAFLAALARGKSDGLLMPFPQTGIFGAEGAPRINGAGQAGTSLAVDGLPSGKAIGSGTFLSIIAGSRRYLYMVAQSATANGSGAVTLSVEPMLRATPEDNAIVEIETPMIQGELDSGDLPWSLDVAKNYGLSFTVRESR